MALSQALATVDELTDRLGEEITSPEEVAMARFFLRKASAEARHHGAPWPDPILCPDVVRVIVIEAATRGFQNPEGFQLERGDEITFQREATHAAGSALTATEIKIIRQAAGKGVLTSARLVKSVSLSGDA